MHLLVTGLAAHIAATERRQHQADMRAGPQVTRCTGPRGMHQGAAVARHPAQLPRRRHCLPPRAGLGPSLPAALRRLACPVRSCPRPRPLGTAPQAPRQQSARLLMERFVASLAVECPRLGFRDVVDAAQVRGRSGQGRVQRQRVPAQPGAGGLPLVRGAAAQLSDASAACWRIFGDEAQP